MQEGPGQERMCGQDPSPDWCKKAGCVDEGTVEGSQADKPRALHLKLPGCLSPFLLAHACPALSFGRSRSSQSWRFAVGRDHPAFSQQPSVFLSSPLQQGEYISLLLHMPTYLEFAGSRHFSCVAFGTR